MWEWENEPGDGGDGGGGIGGDALIESQRLELERRKQKKQLDMEINKALDDRISAYKKMIEIGRLEIQQMEEALKNQQKATTAKKEAYEKLDDLLEKEGIKLDEARGNIGAQSAEIRKAIANYDKMLAIEEKRTATLRGQKDTILANSKLSEKSKKALSEAFDAEEIDEGKIKQLLAEANAEFDLTVDAVGETEKAFGFLSKSIGITSDASQTGFGRMIEGAVTFGKVVMKDPSKGLGMLKAGLFSMLSPINLMGNMLSMATKAFFDSEEAAISMTTAFGGSVKENQRLVQESLGPMKKYNVELKEIGQSYIALEGSIIGFNNLTKQQKKNLAENSAIAKKFGVDEKALATQTQKLAYSFGGLGAGTDKAQEKILKFAKSSQTLGYTMAESIQMLSQFGGSVASMGGDVTNELQKMQAMAKATGAEMGQLLAVAKKFNTFKDGANAAAQLNSVFGTSISQIDLMGRTAEDRNKIIAQSLVDATGGYDAMTEHQRLAAAEMLGFGDDVLKLQGYMHGQTAADKAAAEAQKEQAEAMESLKNTAMDMVPTLTKLIKKFEEAFISSGAFENIMRILDAQMPNIIATVEGLAFVFGKLVEYLDIAVVAYGMYRTAQMAAMAYQAGYTALVSAGTITDGAAASAKLALGSASYYAYGAILVLGLILLAIFAILHMTGSPALWEIAGVMALGVILLGTAFYFAGPAIMAALPALIVIMAGLVGIFYVLPPLIDAIGRLATSFIDLIVTAVSNVFGLYLVAGGLMAIGGAFFFLGNMALMATMGILAGTIALVALRASMALSGTSFDDLVSIGEGVSKMGDGIRNLKEGLSGLAGAAASIMSGIGNKNIMIRGDASGTTLVAGKGGLFAFIPPKITVDVNMDKAQMPAPIVNVTVTLDGDELRHIISEEIANTKG